MMEVPKPNYFSKFVLRLGIALFFLSITSLLFSLYLFKESDSLNSRVDTIVKYVRNKQTISHDSTTTKSQVEVDSLMRLLEFKSVKEDYYIQQLNTQTTWVVTIVTILFLIFTILEYTVFERKVEQIQEKQTESYKENEKKFHHFESDFKALKEEIRVNTENFKRDLQANFSKFAGDFESKFKKMNVEHLSLMANVSFSSYMDFLERGRFYESALNGLFTVSYRLMSLSDSNNLTPENIQISIPFLNSLNELLNQESVLPKISQALIDDKNYNQIIAAIDNISAYEHMEMRAICAEIRVFIKKTKDKLTNPVV